MATRTWVLLAILVAVAGLSIPLLKREKPSPAGGPIPYEARTDAEPREYPRVSDGARVLGPFAGRLARMADAFDDDLGIDVHIVTRNDADASIEQQVGGRAALEGATARLSRAVAGARSLALPQELAGY